MQKLSEQKHSCVTLNPMFISELNTMKTIYFYQLIMRQYITKTFILHKANVEMLAINFT